VATIRVIRGPAGLYDTTGSKGLTTFGHPCADSLPRTTRISRFMPLDRAPGPLRPPASLLAAVLGLTGCVCPPDLEDWAELGYRTPQQTLRSFQLAVRADAPAVEYRCLSVNLRRGLPQIAWREAREEWYAENPFLRSGIAKAEIASEQRLGDDRYRFVVESYGKSFFVELVREDFAQVYGAEGELVVDELLPYDPGDPYLDDFYDFLSVSPPENGTRFIAGGVTVRAADVSSSVSELRLAREWKVDAFGPADESPGASSAGPPQNSP
jgi:hypothetical protein